MPSKTPCWVNDRVMYRSDGKTRKKKQSATVWKERILEIERRNTRSHSVENSLRKRLWTCRKRLQHEWRNEWMQSLTMVPIVPMTCTAFLYIFHKTTWFSNKLVYLNLFSFSSSHEYYGIHISSGWCSVSVKTIICCDGLVGPVCPWAQCCA